MKVYRIKNWDALYENNRTRGLKHLDWIPVPNSHDGEGFTLVMSEKDGPQLFGAWMVILQVASKCEMRGTLLRDTGMPHDATSIARLTRFPQQLIQKALEFFSSKEIQWMQVSTYEGLASDSSESGTLLRDGDVDSALSCPEGKGRECTEGKEGNVAPNKRDKPARSKRRVLSDEEFLAEIRINPAFRHVDLDLELSKMDAWLLTPKGRGRTKTHGFIVNWLNKIDRPTSTVPAKAAAEPKPVPKWVVDLDAVRGDYSYLLGCHVRDEMRENLLRGRIDRLPPEARNVAERELGIIIAWLDKRKGGA